MPGTLWDWEFAGHTDLARKELLQILPNIESRDATITPKPTSLIRRVLEVATHQNSLILDSFSGSGSTARAVLEANQRDGGNRRFILVEMEDYADRLTAERVRRVANGYDFQGTQKTELLRERLTFSALKSSEKLLHQIDGIENLQGHEFDRIKKEVKDGELIVTGEKSVESRAEGLGGSFTYCTLGEPIEVGQDPDRPGLTRLRQPGCCVYCSIWRPVKFWTQQQCVRQIFYLGATKSQHVWLIYQPDLEWLKSQDAALTLPRARSFAASDAEKRHLVFAPARYVSQKMLAEQNLPVEFVPLPFALYRIDRS